MPKIFMGNPDRVTFKPRFYAVRTPEEQGEIAKGLERLSNILANEAQSFPGGMPVNVWSLQTGSEVYPAHNQVDNWMIYAEDKDSPARDNSPIHSYVAKGSKFVRITLGEDTGRLTSFNFHYEPLDAAEYEEIMKRVSSERKQDERSAESQ